MLTILLKALKQQHFHGINLRAALLQILKTPSPVQALSDITITNLFMLLRLDCGHGHGPEIVLILAYKNSHAIFNPLQNSMASFQSFKDTFKGLATTEGDDGYDIKRWADNASRKAKYVVYPQDAEDVAKAVLFVQAAGLDLAVRGGGHSSSGASSSEGGLVIDLSKTLNKVKIDAENQLAYTQGGATWETVDIEAFKFGGYLIGMILQHEMTIAGYL